MAETAVKLVLGFSVADAGFPRFFYDENDLMVAFREWTEDEIELRFPTCYALCWQAAVVQRPGETEGDVFEIQGSEWLARHRAERAVEPQEPIRHFKLNFNAWGQLEVLAEDMVLLSRTPGASG